MVGLKGESSSRSKALIAEQKRLCLPSGEKLEFEQFGENPNSLFISGIHGDEKGVIGRLRTQLNRTMVVYPRLLNNVLRVFQAYPEAISAGTRGVVSGTRMDDLERSFPKPGRGEISHPQAVLLAELLKNYPDLEFLFSFHEDTRWNSPDDYVPKFYIYDVSRTGNEKDQQTVTNLCKELIAKIKKKFRDNIVHSGIDDYELQIEIDDGYKLTPAVDFEVGDFETYAVETGRIGKSKIKRAFFFEIPTDLTIAEKDKMVALILNDFIIPFLEFKRSGS